jgi:asparagine synthetase B (glutamine-hydrolysing)
VLHVQHVSVPRPPAHGTRSELIGLCFLLSIRARAGSVWVSSEMKALNEDCVRFEIFPPGHLYSSAAGGFRRWYNPHWFLEQVPATPYQPLVLRDAFEKVRRALLGQS